ncbi:MAG: alpha/beta hydrolase-fold protein [Bacteroidota bacterium]
MDVCKSLTIAWLAITLFSYHKGISNHKLENERSDQIISVHVGLDSLGEVRIIDERFEIPQLNRERRIWIYLPPNYEQGDKRYPVVYMHDGQNLFDAKTAFAGEWGIDESMNQLFGEGQKSAIIVGIDNGGDRRMHEYSPWVNSQYGGGEGEQYGKFIVETLKPYIDEHFRTLPDREHTGIMGSSMGGLISYYIGLQYQDTFSRLGIFSPSFWFGQELHDFALDFKPTHDFKIYFLMGAKEGKVMVNNMKKVYNELLQAGIPKEQMFYLIAKDGEHREWFWQREFPKAYTWMFAE